MTAPRTTVPLVIDARPRGPRGMLAWERIRGKTVLDHLLDLIGPGEVTIQVETAHQSEIAGLIAERGHALSTAPAPAGAIVLRTDRLYDRGRLRKALRRGEDAESAVLWRLDTPGGLEGAEDEWTRRRTYQPIGRFWALDPARALARALAPTRVHPNAVTVAAALLMLGASGLIACATGLVVNLAEALAMAVALVLDTADGHLARLQGTASPFGKWLDGWLDELCDMALHAAISWACFLRSGHPGWLLLGMAYGMGKYVFFIGMNLMPTGNEPADALRTADDDVSPLRAAVRLAGHADIRWHSWIVLAALGRLDVGLVLYAAYYPARSVLGAVAKAKEARRA